MDRPGVGRSVVGWSLMLAGLASVGLGIAALLDHQTVSRLGLVGVVAIGFGLVLIGIGATVAHLRIAVGIADSALVSSGRIGPALAAAVGVALLVGGGLIVRTGDTAAGAAVTAGGIAVALSTPGLWWHNEVMVGLAQVGLAVAAFALGTILFGRSATLAAAGVTGFGVIVLVGGVLTVLSGRATQRWYANPRARHPESSDSGPS